MTRVLIVDDSKPIRQYAREAFSELGFTNIHEATNGAEALEMTRAQMPDVILLDWNMPLMNGIDFAKTLRRTAGGDTPKIIFCTYESRHSKILTAFQSGADEYIVKPLDINVLRGKLELLEIKA